MFIIKNYLCQVRSTLVNSNEPLYYPFGLRVNKCGWSYNDPHAWICVPDKVQNIKVKIFNLVSRENKTIFYFNINCVSANAD